MVNMCIMCKKDSETVKHLFGDCQTANQIRLQILVQHAEASQCSFFSNEKFRKALLNSQKMAVRRLQLVFCFVIWRERCRRIFQEKFKTVTLLTSEIMVECGSWYQQEQKSIKEHRRLMDCAWKNHFQYSFLLFFLSSPSFFTGFFSFLGFYWILVSAFFYFYFYFYFFVFRIYDPCL